MPKLFQICVEGNTGSTGTIAEGIGELVMQNGWESYIAHGRFPRHSKSSIIRIGSDLDIILHGIETRLFDRHGLGSRKATKILIKQIREIQPDIIHLHHLHGYYLNIKILFEFLSKAKIPVVWTFHDCWSFTGHCAHFDFVGCEKWKIECNCCPQRNEYPASLLIDRSNKNFHQKKKWFTSVDGMVVVSVSQWLDMVVSQSFLRNAKHKVIYNGVDIEIFKPSVNQIDFRKRFNVTDSFLILGVASPWSKRKGFDDFLVLSKYLKKDEIIVLVGLDSRQIKKLPPNIIGISRTENKQQLVDIYCTADVFINLSVEETFGLTTAEALACGTPSIVYNTTACPEVIDNETGIVVEKKDFEGLIKAISEIRNKRKIFYSHKCRDRAVKLFNKEERFMEYLDLYKGISKNI